MAQTIRLTITSDLEKALEVLRQSTLGTLNTTELIKLAVGGYAQVKKAQGITAFSGTVNDISPSELDRLSASSFYEWAKEDGTLNVDNIAHPETLKPFEPKSHV